MGIVGQIDKYIKPGNILLLRWLKPGDDVVIKIREITPYTTILNRATLDVVYSEWDQRDRAYTDKICMTISGLYGWDLVRLVTDDEWILLRLTDGEAWPES